jgi:hypothetical protein
MLTVLRMKRARKVIRRMRRMQISCKMLEAPRGRRSSQMEPQWSSPTPLSR